MWATLSVFVEIVVDNYFIFITSVRLDPNNVRCLVKSLKKDLGEVPKFWAHIYFIITRQLERSTLIFHST